MSHEEEDAFWNTSEVRPFNFEDEDQSLSNNTVNSSSTYAITTNNQNSNPPPPSNPSVIKTIGNVLAATSSPDEPFLKPSIIMCNGDKIEKLIEHLDKCYSIPNQNEKIKQDPKLYISDIVNKRVPIDFSPYKSKREKLLLLDCAICCSDGNAITAATIFISKTLKQSIFISELKKRPMAVDHYINYLESTGRSREVLELTRTLSTV